MFYSICPTHSRLGSREDGTFAVWAQTLTKKHENSQLQTLHFTSYFNYSYDCKLVAFVYKLGIEHSCKVVPFIEFPVKIMYMYAK